MLLTETDAKTKWCPFARTLDNQGSSGLYEMPIVAAVNREPGDYDEEGAETVLITGRHRCIASACMAWRWGTKVNPDYRPSMMQVWPPSSEPPQYIHDGEHGRCGLAGVVLP